MKLRYVGEEVTWESQAGGRTTTKQGVIVEVVPALRSPSLGELRQYHAPHSVGNPRNHESYLVAVPNKSGRGRPHLYWPVVSLLKEVVNEPVTV